MADARCRPRRPAVTLHFAQTLDGRIATRTGSSRWISGDASLRLAHQLRAEHDAVLVGVGTVWADDPRLTVRLVPGRSPLRVVLDSAARTPPGCRLLAAAGPPTVILATPRADPRRVAALRAAGAEVVVLRPDPLGRVELGAALAELAAREVGSVLVEGGREVITSVLRDRLADRLVLALAFKLLGSGIDAVGDLGIHALGDAVTLTDQRVTRLGDELVIDGRLCWARGTEPALAPQEAAVAHRLLGELQLGADPGLAEPVAR